MCIVIDANCLTTVFNDKNMEHKKFRPVLRWIVAGKGKVVYGGRKYKKELNSCEKVIPLLAELERAGKVLPVADERVDYHQCRIEQQTSGSGFNDCHLAAIIIVSGCKLICTSEKRAIPFLKKASLYPSHVKVPKIFRGYRQNTQLLSDKYIADCCKPTVKGTRELRLFFGLR